MRARKRVSPISFNTKVLELDVKKKEPRKKLGSKGSLVKDEQPIVEHVSSAETPVVVDEVAADITAQTEEAAPVVPVTGARARVRANRKRS